MSAKVVICLMLCLLAVASPVFAQGETSEYLKIIEIWEIVDDDGDVEVVGVIQNTHPYLSAESIQLVLTLKKGGVVVAVLNNVWCGEYSTTEKTCEFAQELYGYKREDYDSVEGRIAQSYFSMPMPDPWLLTGELYLVEESLNVHASDDGWIVIVGEMHNGTNAILDIESIAFGLWDVEENFLGWANDVYFMFFSRIDDVMPGESVSFYVGNTDIPFDRVARYRIDVEYSISRYIDQSIATSVDAASWGQIKAMGR